jgi:acetylornithine deacetylase
LSANLFALRALHAAGFEAAADIYLQSVVEEECTGNGALACLQRGYRAAAALIPEPAAERLNHAQVGVMWFQVRVRGRPVHVAVAGSGSNAIESCFPLVAALHRLEHDWNHRGHEAFKQHHHPLNFVLSRIEGGDWTSSVPAWCTFDMRVGLFPGQNLQEARKEIEQCVHRAALEDGFLRENPPELVYHGFQAEGYVLPPHTPAQACLEQAHRHVRQEPLEQYAGTGTTDARFFGLYQGIPALVYGPRSRDIHGFDEAVEIDSVRRVTKTIASFIAQWCGLQRIKH